MCDYCGKNWIEIPSRYPCGPCPDEWKCPDCGKRVSPCCGAEIIDVDFEEGNEVHEYCGTETCSKCDGECHCGGCI